MKPIAIVVCLAAALALPGGAAQAQFLPGTAPTNLPPPPPPAPPPPKIEVPVVPKLDAPPHSPRAQLPNRGSFGDRVIRCLDDGAAIGLNSTDRAAYSRACANQ